LDFCAVEALVANLQQRAESFGRSQVLNGVTDGFSRCGEAPVLFSRAAYRFERNSSAGES
jgi:hypothetical protein